MSMDRGLDFATLYNALLLITYYYLYALASCSLLGFRDVDNEIHTAFLHCCG